MGNKKIKENQKKNLMIFILVVGIAFCVGAIAFIVNTIDFALNSTEVDAKIVDIQYDPDDEVEEIYVSYTVDGKIYAHKELNAISGFWDEGDVLKVRYRNDNPNEVKWILADALVCIILFVIAALLVSISSIFLAKLGKKKKADKKLVESGRKCYAYVVDIIPDFSTRINGRYPYSTVVCKSNETGSVRTYASDSGKIADIIFIGDLVAVYCDPTNPSLYFVDLNDYKRGDGKMPSFASGESSYGVTPDGEIFDGIWEESAPSATTTESKDDGGLRLPDDDLFS